MLTLARPRSAAHDVFVPGAGGPTVNLGDFNKPAGNFGLAAAGVDVTPDDWAVRPPGKPQSTQRVNVQTLVV